MSEALISRLGRAEARASAPAEVPLRAPTVIGSFLREIVKVNFPEFLGASEGAATEAWIGKDGDVLRTSQLYLPLEGPHGGLSLEGERSSMVEDAPTTAGHGR
jgi:hypothetical protein